MAGGVELKPRRRTFGSEAGVWVRDLMRGRRVGARDHCAQGWLQSVLMVSPTHAATASRAPAPRCCVCAVTATCEMPDEGPSGELSL